jgi:pimeloyl-ACP methyl ester carboxylesterase
VKIASNNIQIYAREQGAGDLAFLFLHYWGGSSRSWEGVAAELAKSHRAIAIDHRGWGDSDVAPDDNYRITDFADDAQGVIEALNLKNYVLVGHSMGGKVAQLLASRQPDGLNGLVLVAPSPPFPMAIPAEQIEIMTHAYDSAESVGWVLDNVMTGHRLEGAVRLQIIEDSLRGAQQAKVAWPTVALHEDISNEVASINVPTLIIGGELDKIDSAEMLRQEVLPRIAHARLKVLPGVGHLSPFEAPEAIAREILTFLPELKNSLFATEF